MSYQILPILKMQLLQPKPCHKFAKEIEVEAHT